MIPEVRTIRNRMLVVLFFLTAASIDAAAQYEVVTDFDVDLDGWTGQFADYPVGEEGFYELERAHRPLPAEVGERGALFLSGNNHSDDLFMYAYKQVDGLSPLTRYAITFEITFASNAAVGSIGIGGSPAESVYMKAGASAAMVDRRVDAGNFYRMTIDKGEQANGGRDAVVLGHIGKPEDGTDDYVILTRTNRGGAALTATSDESGRLWLLFGTDSGFEGLTSLYYTGFQATFSESPDNSLPPACGGVDLPVALGLIIFLLGAGRFQLF